MKAKTIAFVGIGLVATFVLFVLAWASWFSYLGYQGWKDTISWKIDELFERLDDGGFGETYDTETTPELRSIATREQYVEMGQLVKDRLGQLESKVVKSFNTRLYNGTPMIEAVFTGTFTNGIGIIETRFARVTGGDWKIDQLRVDSSNFADDWEAVKCPNCGALQNAEAPFCSKCGNELPAAGS